MTTHLTDLIAFDKRSAGWHPRSNRAIGLDRRRSRLLAGRAKRLLANTSLDGAKVRVVVFAQGRTDVVDRAGNVGKAGEVGRIDVGRALAAGKRPQRLDELVEARHRRVKKNPHRGRERDDGTCLNRQHRTQRRRTLLVHDPGGREAADAGDDDDTEHQDVAQSGHRGRLTRQEF